MNTVTDLSGEGHCAIKPGHKLFKKLGSAHSCLATLNRIDMLPFECMGCNISKRITFTKNDSLWLMELLTDGLFRSN